MSFYSLIECKVGKHIWDLKVCRWFKKSNESGRRLSYRLQSVFCVSRYEFLIFSVNEIKQFPGRDEKSWKLFNFVEKKFLFFLCLRTFSAVWNFSWELPYSRSSLPRKREMKWNEINYSSNSISFSLTYFKFTIKFNERLLALCEAICFLFDLGRSLKLSYLLK